MKKFFSLTSAFFAWTISTYSQNSSPYWSLAGNSNVSSSSKLGTTNAQNLRIITNNAERIRVDASSGNVGIGTSETDFRLSVKSSIVQISNNTHLLKLSGRNPLLSFYDENNIPYGYIKSWTNAPSALFTKGMLIGSNPGFPIFLSTNFGPTMTLDNNNNVGIGTITPHFKLEVKSSVLQVSNNTHLLQLTGRNPLMSFCDENNTPYGYIKTWTDAPTAPFTKGMLIGSNPGFPIFLSTHFGLSMIITDNGNVGIGTANPQHKLSVNGTVQAKELRCESNWADYVFEKDYKLPTLKAVEKFIVKNNHLPNIPSANNIRKHGLAVGEVQTKMMEKIEELTLYVIDLQKQISQLKAEKNETR